MKIAELKEKPEFTELLNIVNNDTETLQHIPAEELEDTKILLVILLSITTKFEDNIKSLTEAIEAKEDIKVILINTLSTKYNITIGTLTPCQGMLPLTDGLDSTTSNILSTIIYSTIKPSTIDSVDNLIRDLHIKPQVRVKNQIKILKELMDEKVLSKAKLKRPLVRNTLTVPDFLAYMDQPNTKFRTLFTSDPTATMSLPSIEAIQADMVQRLIANPENCVVPHYVLGE